MPDFRSTDFQSSRTDQQLGTIIREGRGMMPAFAGKLNDDGLAVLVEFIRGLAPPEDAPRPERTAPPTAPDTP